MAIGKRYSENKLEISEKMIAHSKHPWIQLLSLRKAQVLLILSCNAAACIGNYFRAETYTKKGWNT